ncbi:fungal hydrophobin-domain-containing protein [Flammula alnicola]|nr:fungal hydrophobin-domain-containing protein [Flammula alnicola]
MYQIANVALISVQRYYVERYKSSLIRLAFFTRTILSIRSSTTILNMQFKLSALATVALATTLAAATLTRRQSDQCNTGSIQCCNSVQSASTPSVATLLGLLGIAAQGVTGLVGVTCSPITGVGVSGTSCSAQPVCCTNDSFNGVVALGCTPINIAL